MTARRATGGSGGSGCCFWGRGLWTSVLGEAPWCLRLVSVVLEILLCPGVGNSRGQPLFLAVGGVSRHTFHHVQSPLGRSVPGRTRQAFFSILQHPHRGPLSPLPPVPCHHLRVLLLYCSFDTPQNFLGGVRAHPHFSKVTGRTKQLGVSCPGWAQTSKRIACSGMITVSLKSQL